MGSSDITVALIRERINYEMLFSEFVKLKGNGNERMALCVFHDNTDSPALSINVAEGIYHCKNPACDARGDVFSFYQRIRSCTFPEAVAELARRCGLPEPEKASQLSHEEIQRKNAQLLEQWQSGQSTVPPPVQPVIHAPAPDEDRTIDEAIVEAMNFRLLNSEPRIQWLTERRGLTMDTIEKFKLGHDGQRYYIPVRDGEGRLVNIRRYMPDARKSHEKMISWREGYGKARLFPIDHLTDGQPIFLFEGEMDCLLAQQLGLNALTTTGGAGTWRDQWNLLFVGRDVVICYDADEAGRRGAHAVAGKIAGTARSVRILNIPLAEPVGADFTDYIVGHGHSINDFMALLEQARPFQADPSDIAPPTGGGEPTLLHLSQASRAEHYNQPIRFNVMVSGKTTSPYIIPKIVRAGFCPQSVRGELDMCENCPVAQSSGSVTVELEFDSNEVLTFTNTTDSLLKKAVKAKVGIPTKCGFSYHEVLEAMNVEEIQLIPEVERTEAEAPYVTTAAFYLGHGLQANRSYVMTGTTVPEPKRQLSTHIINTAIESQSNIQAFRLTKDVVDRLKVFQPATNDARGLWQHVSAMYGDIERFTRIYQRRDLMLAVDMTFHSVLQFMFQGERLKRGWTEALIIGDSRTGKTTIVQRLLDYYGAGEFSSGENTTLAGLVGGLHQIGTSWALQWGKIPLNDGRLLAIDEAGNLPPEQIARMSSMRSSGVAEVIKVHTERTNSRTRQIWISNPRTPRPLSSFSQGVLAVKELIGAPEDIARFDMVVSAASGDVPLAVVNAAREQETPETYTSELCHQRVMWAWSRKAEQVVFAEGATETVLRIATEHGEQYRYATEIPLVEPNEQRVKLARLAVATAAIFFSASEDGEHIVVLPCHVEFAAQFLTNLYKKPSLSFVEYAANQRTRYVISNEDQVDRIIRAAPQSIRAFMEQEQFTQRDLQEILGIGDRDEIRIKIASLRESGFLRRQGSSFYLKTPAAIRWLRTRLSDTNGHREQTDFSEMTLEPVMPSEPEF